MNTDSSGAYSPAEVYGQLTSPLTPNSISINSHTPFDEPPQNTRQTYSQDYFNNSKQCARLKYDIAAEVSISTASTLNQGIPSNEITAFTASEADPNDIVMNALKNNCSPEQSIVVKNAHSAYQKCAGFNNPVHSLKNCNYNVS